MNTSLAKTTCNVPPRWLEGAARAVTQVFPPAVTAACGGLPTAVELTASPESTRATAAGSATATQTPPSSYVRPAGVRPTRTACTSWVAGSMRSTVPSPLFATHR